MASPWAVSGLIHFVLELHCLQKRICVKCKNMSFFVQTSCIFAFIFVTLARNSRLYYIGTYSMGV